MLLGSGLPGIQIARSPTPRQTGTGWKVGSATRETTAPTAWLHHRTLEVWASEMAFYVLQAVDIKPAGPIKTTLFIFAPVLEDGVYGWRSTTRDSGWLEWLNAADNAMPTQDVVVLKRVEPR